MSCHTALCEDTYFLALGIVAALIVLLLRTISGTISSAQLAHTVSICVFFVTIGFIVDCELTDDYLLTDILSIQAETQSRRFRRQSWFRVFGALFSVAFLFVILMLIVGETYARSTLSVMFPSSALAFSLMVLRLNVKLGGDIFTPQDGWRKSCMLIIGSPIMLGVIGVAAILSAFLHYLLCTVSGIFVSSHILQISCQHFR
jgi:hypothetical protein